MNLRTKIGVVAVLLSTLTVQAQNIPFRKAERNDEESCRLANSQPQQGRRTW